MEEEVLEKAAVKTGWKIPALFTEETPPRYLLIFCSAAVLLLAAALSGVAFSLDSPVYWLAGTFMWIIWFIVMFFIVTPGTDKRFQPYQKGLKTGAQTIFTVVFTVGILEIFVVGLFSYWYVNSGADNNFVRVMEELQSAFRYNDGTALNQQATENFLAGKNPYANANIVETFIKFNGHYDRLTPLRTGSLADTFPYPSHQQLEALWASAVQNPSQPPPELESHVCYPAGAFILPAPFLAMGIKDIRIIYFILSIAGLAYAVWMIPNRRRLIFVGLIVISLEIWNILAVGESGTIIFPFLLIAWMTIGKNNWLSALFMGIAVATKQTAWFFLPFYFILIWRTVNPKTVLAAIGIIAGIFALFNGYYIIQDPSLWLESVTSPITENMFPLGVGIITLVTTGIINIQSSLPFSIMEIAVFIGGGLWYIFNARKYPEAGPVLAVLPLFFAWRSLWTYFFYVTIIIFAMMVMRGERIEVKEEG